MFPPVTRLLVGNVICIHGMDVVEHHPGKRVQIPVDAEGVVGCQAGALGRQTVEHVDVREAIGQFPGAVAGGTLPSQVRTWKKSSYGLTRSNTPNFRLYGRFSPVRK